MSILIRFSAKTFARPMTYIINSSRHISQDQKSPNTNKNQDPQHYDIIIAGGGLVGTALACGIAKTKVLAEKKVLLLEGAPPFKGFTGGQYGNRVSAINNGSIELFKSIGAWDKISSARYKPVKQMQVWDASSDALITFNHDNFSENVACIIENDLMLDSIYSQLESAQNVTILNKSTVANVELRMDGNIKNIVGLKNGDSMSCDLLNIKDVQLSESCTEDLNNSEDSELGQTLMTSNANLVTINEEKSCGPDVPNETLSDATINCLLDAPCSTPYNHQKVTNETTFQQKQLRVLVKKINQEELLQFLQLDTQNDHCSRVNVSRFKNTSFQSKSAQIEACHTERKCSQLNGSHITTLNNTAHKYNINSSSDKEYFTEAKPMFKQKKENLNSSRDKTMKKPIKRGVRNKENCDTDSDFTCSDDESNVGRRRLRNKKLSLKEPSLRAKLRNTTNIKL